MKKAIVVGGSAGMGKEVALILAKNGCKVAITGRNTNRLQEVKSLNPTHIICFPFDLIDLKNEEKLNGLVEELKGLDLLIISAGRGDINPQILFDTDKKIIDLNVMAFTQVINWGFIFFKKQGYGQIVGFTSIAGMRGIRHAPAYSASKSYQIKYFESLRQKTVKEKLKITLTEVRPGFVDTKKVEVKKFWSARPEIASKQIYRAIKNKRSVVYITKRWGLIGFILNFIPRFIYDRL